MKNYVLGLLAIILAVGLSAFNYSNNGTANEPLQSFTWHKYNAEGTAELTPVVPFTGTSSGARNSFLCPDPGERICARAYDDEGNPLEMYITKPAP